MICLNVLNRLRLFKKKYPAGWNRLGLPALLAHCLYQWEVRHVIKLCYFVSYLFSLLIGTEMELTQYVSSYQTSVVIHYWDTGMSQKVTVRLIKWFYVCVWVCVPVVNQGQERQKAPNCCFSSCRWWARTLPGLLHRRKVLEWSRPSYRAGTEVALGSSFIVKSI